MRAAPSLCAALLTSGLAACDDGDAGRARAERAEEAAPRTAQPAPAPDALPMPDVAPPRNTPGDPARRDALVRDARAQMAAAQWKKAIATLEAALAAGPEDATMRVLLGVCRSNDMQDVVGARREFERACALDARNADARVYLADLALTRADHAAARRYGLEALAADPRHFHAQLLVAEMHRTDGAIAAATELVEQHLRDHPGSARGHRERAALHQHGGRNDFAIEDLQRAVALDPIDTAARWALASALRRAGRHAEAEVVRADFELLKSIFSRSVHDLEPDPAAREAILVRIVERFPAVWQPRLELARARAGTHGSAAAAAVLREAVAAFPEIAPLRAQLALHLEALGDHEGAARERSASERILADAPGDP